MTEENSRTNYGINSEQAGYGETTKDFFEMLDGSIDGITKSPINHSLKTFSREFVHNERMGMQLFNILTNKIDSLSKTIEESPIYTEMDVVKTFLAIIEYMSSWSLNQRQSIILAKLKMQEIKKVVDDDYIPRRQYDKEIEEFELLVDKEAKGLQLPVHGTGGTMHIVIPAIYRPQFSEGEMVLIRKILPKK